MYCERCGAENKRHSKFCAECGYDLRENIPTADVGSDVLKKRKSDRAQTILFWGIISLAFAAQSSIPWLGWIFSAKARALVSDYLAEFDEMDPRARIGRDLGIAARIVGMVRTLIMAAVILTYLLVYVVYLCAILGILRMVFGG